MTGRVTVVGLGPAGPEHLTSATLEALARPRPRFIRTTRHPSASTVLDAVSFDDLYEGADSFDEVYSRIVERLVAEVEAHGGVLYAVPGSPRVLERSVELLVAAPGVDVEVIPALSFLDLVWDRLGVDPVEVGARLVDGHRFATEAAGERGPLLVAHCHNRRVLSEIKLAVDEPPAVPVVVLARLGAADEAVSEVPWAELDRGVVPDHLTSVWIPALAAPVAGELVRFNEVVAELRERCPWDREQTHASLVPHLLEESYEVVEAIETLDAAGPDTRDAAYTHLEEELGDLLFQVMFHSRLAAEEGRFTVADVARTVHDKLRHRHPHVFGELEVSGPDQVVANWERIKQAEKSRDSVMDGIPTTLPAPMYAAKVLSRAARAEGGETDLSPLAVRLGELLEGSDAAQTDQVGQLLLAAVELARSRNIDAEVALRTTAARRADEVRRAGH